MIDVCSPEALYERINACTSCENNMLGICKKCGCIIQAKIRIANTTCPINLWAEDRPPVATATEEHS
jgi:hypothetical protein